MKKEKISRERIPRAAIAAFAAVVLGGALILGSRLPRGGDVSDFQFPESKFGNFLALHHAIYADDFDRVADLSAPLADEGLPIVQNSRATALFLAGKIDDSAKFLANDKNMAAQVAYAAHLAKTGDWAGLYKRFRNNNSQVLAPFRIWSGVAAGKTDESLKFIDKLSGNDSWTVFLRGQVYAETGKPQNARDFFKKVSTDFMNLNDYMYIMSFYRNFGFDEEFDALRADFTSRPGGMHMQDFTEFSDFAAYSGPENALAFGLVQNVSHSPILNASSLALLLLRAAEAVGPPSLHSGVASGPGRAVAEGIGGSLNYYLGMFFYTNDSDKYQTYFDSIEKDRIFAPFVFLKKAEKAGNFNKMKRELERSVAKNPLFLPALNKLIAINMQKGRENDAFRLVNNALKYENLSDRTKAFFLATRARLYRQTGKFDRALDDITHAKDLSPGDANVLAEMAKIWIARRENLSDAYDVGLAMVAKYPTDLDGWIILALTVREKEGAPNALEILERVGRVAQTNSYLFENLGDIYVEMGEFKSAKSAYLRALELSDDGLTSESKLKAKIRKLK